MSLGIQHDVVVEAPVAWDSRLTTEWQELCDRTAAPYFRRPEWVRAWHEVYEPSARLTALVLRDPDGALAGLLCLAQQPLRLPGGRTLPLQVIRQAGAGRGAADHCGPVSTGVATDRRLFAALLDAHRDVVLEAQCDGAAVEELAARARRVERRGVPHLVLQADVDVAATWPKSLRQDVRRCGRRLQEAGVELRWTSPRDPGFAAGVGRLSELHTRRWSARGQAGLLDEQRQAVLRRAGELASDGCGPHLVQAVHDGTVIGSLVTFLDRTRSNYYQLGWDPEWARLSLGRMLVVEAVLRAQAQGRTRFDFLRGDDDYKYDLGAVDEVDVDLVIGRGSATAVELGVRRLRARRAARSAA